MLIHFVLLASATFYGGGGVCANGRTPAQNAARYHNICAYNHCPLGRTLIASRGGRHVRYVVVDRIGHGSDLDVWGKRAFALLAGPGAQRTGRVSVHIRVLSGRVKAHVRHLRRKYSLT